MKIFVLLSRVPYPLEKGDKLRAFHQVKHLSKNHEVYLFCLNDIQLKESDVDVLKKFCKEVHVLPLSRFKIITRLLWSWFSKKPYQVNYFYQSSIAKKIIKEINRIKPDRIYAQLIRTSEYVKHLHNYNKTFDYMDALSKGMQRRIENGNFITRPFIRSEANRLTTYENLIFDYFEKKTIISEQDRNHIYHSDRSEIEIIRNGVDFTTLTPMEVEKEYDLLFHGNLNYPPNIDCIRYMAQEILPLLVEKKIQFKMLISGANPGQKIFEYTKKFPQVHVKGWVEDIRESYAKSKIFLAPMQIGTGMQNKLLEAMSMKVPCITSALSNTPIGTEDKVHVLIGKNREEYVQHIIELINDPTRRDQLATEAHAYVHANYSWESTNQALEALILK